MTRADAPLPSLFKANGRIWIWRPWLRTRGGPRLVAGGWVRGRTRGRLIGSPAWSNWWKFIQQRAKRDTCGMNTQGIWICEQPQKSNVWWGDVKKLTYDFWQYLCRIGPNSLMGSIKTLFGQAVRFGKYIETCILGGPYMPDSPVDSCQVQRCPQCVALVFGASRAFCKEVVDLQPGHAQGGDEWLFIVQIWMDVCWIHDMGVWIFLTNLIAYIFQYIIIYPHPREKEESTHFLETLLIISTNEYKWFHPNIDQVCWIDWISWF